MSYSGTRRLDHFVAGDGPLAVPGRRAQTVEQPHLYESTYVIAALDSKAGGSSRQPNFTAWPAPRCPHGSFARWAAGNCCAFGAPDDRPTITGVTYANGGASLTFTPPPVGPGHDPQLRLSTVLRRRHDHQLVQHDRRKHQPPDHRRQLPAGHHRLLTHRRPPRRHHRRLVPLAGMR
jgi:hypothetical protein